MKTRKINEKLKHIKYVGLTVRPDSPELKPYYEILKSKFESYGAKLVVASKSAKFLGVEGIDFDEVCQKCDFLISPILGINAGKLGFLTEIRCDEIEEFIDRIFKGEYRIDTRMALDVTFKKDNKTKKAIAFNDIVFSRSCISGMVTLKA